MQKRILIISKLDEITHELIRKKCLAAVGGVAAGKGSFMTEIEILDEIETFRPNIMVVGADKITERIIELARDLQIIMVTRGNPVNVDLDCCKKNDVIVTNTPGRNANSVAELVIGLIICCARHVFSAHDSVRSGRASVKNFSEPVNRERDIIWISPSLKDVPHIAFRGTDILGKALGIIGFGAIGRRTASKAKALGMKVIAYDPNVSESALTEVGVEKTDLKDLLSESDFISLHCSETAETRKLIGEKELFLMRRSAYLINTARGSLIDHDALYNALKEKRIAGAAVDVFHYEPIVSQDPFLSLDNFIITPHIGGASSDVVTQHSMMIRESLDAFLDNSEEIPYRVV